MIGEIDPVTFEILTHRIWQITDEMGITLERVSGSVVTTDAGDYMTALCRANGDTIMSGCGVLYHGRLGSVVCKNIMERYKDDPGINEGDVFLLNDPYLGVMHSPDAIIASPIHYNGELIGWAATMTHLLDIGGIDPGSFCPSARNVFQEGLRFPGIKIVEGSKLRRDVLESIANMVREPQLVILDIKAEIAAGNVAKERVNELIKNYGIDTVKAVMDELINYSELIMRQRLKELPDGIWRTIEYLDHDGIENKIYKICLEMKKEDDSLIFDFTGSSEQSTGPINITRYATEAAIFATIAPFLCYDIPWNQGILKPINTIIPEGAIVNAKFPAPVSMAPIGSAHLVVDATQVTVSKMLDSSEIYCKEANAIWTGGMPVFYVAGINKNNRYFLAFLMDISAGGGGAKYDMDGVDTGGVLPLSVKCICPNVELEELIYPVLYIFRRQGQNSGGAGRFRGGASIEFSFILHDSPADKEDLILFGMGFEPLQSSSLSGGYPGENNIWFIIRDSDICESINNRNIPEYIDEFKGMKEILPAKGLKEIYKNDIFFAHMMGGGGYGDPMDRDPEMVLKDFINNIISIEYAKDIYGVIINPDTLKLDLEETLKERERIKYYRKSISNRNKTYSFLDIESKGMRRRISGYLEGIKVDSKWFIGCRKCGYVISSLEDNYKEYLLFSEHRLTKAGPSRSDSDRFTLREFYCPGCLTMVNTEMVLKDTPFIWDIQIKEDK